MILLLASFAAAAQVVTFKASVSPTEMVSIKEGQRAAFSISIQHDSRDVESFSVYSPDISWDVHTKASLYVPPTPQGLTTELYIAPLRVPPGIYGVPLMVRLHKSNQEMRLNVPLEVVSRNPSALTYLPALRGTATMSSQVDPRETIRIPLALTNQNRRNLTRVDVKVRSSVINVDKTVALDPLETKTEVIETSIDPLSPPAEDMLRITLVAFDDKNESYFFELPLVQYSVMEYGEVRTSVDERRQFLSTAKVITLTNTGNVPRFEKHSQSLGWFASLFSKTSPAAAWDGTKYVWDVSVGVGESKTIILGVNYWPLFVGVLLFGLAITAYFLFRSPLLVRKRAVVLAQREGGISEIKVIVTLLNRGRAPVHKVRIMDLVPELAELSREAEAGTLAPEKVMRHEKKGTVVKWEIPELVSREERIIVYKIRTKLSVLGGLTLPATLSKFAIAHGVERSTKGNAFNLRI